MKVVSVTYGRFNPPSCEHEKLLDLQTGDVNYIFVGGRYEKPLTLMDRVTYLKWLYPSRFVVPCTHKHCESPLQALYWVYRRHPDYRLQIVCGMGDKGVICSDDGMSLESAKKFMGYNKTKFENSDEFRMNFEEVEIIANERGETSGSHIRKVAMIHNPEHEDEVELFGEMLHSRINIFEAQRILRLLRTYK
jgi:hypothetical protein